VDKIKIRSLFSDKYKLSNGSADSRSIAAVVSHDGTDLTRYRAKRLLKELELVSFQLPKQAYKKVLQPHVAIPNELNRRLMSAPLTRFGLAI